MTISSGNMLAHMTWVCALLYCSLAPAQGGPPMVSDDPGTPGDGKWEINLAWTGERNSGATAQDTPLLDMNYGVGERLQLKYEVPWLVVQQPYGASRSGIGDSLAGVKWRFYDTGDPQRWQISMYPQYEFNTLSGSYERGVVAQGAHLLLPLEFQRSFGNLEVNYELGRTLRTRGAGEDDWFGGLVVGRQVTARFEALLEVQGIFAARFEHNGIILNTGMRYKLRGPFTLLAAVGAGIGASDRPSWIGYLGMQFNSE
jgi:hypothetical protein